MSNREVSQNAHAERLEPATTLMEGPRSTFVVDPTRQALPISCKLTTALRYFPDVHAR